MAENSTSTGSGSNGPGSAPSGDSPRPAWDTIPPLRHPGLPIKLLQRDLKAELGVDTLEGAFPGANHVAEAMRRWDNLSEEQREAYRVRAREAERRYGPSGQPPAQQFRGDHPRLPMKVMMKDVRARIGEEAYAALDWEREAPLRWDALTPEEHLGYKERAAQAIREAE
jgi:hypothetical protein